ncbi:DUF4352 domain-containing protein [Streptomyces lateritius]|uniref:DUF4352 domain-containing protein n=1 Tax=Streptomyces lateritius TaxID=67313 RepID=UPI001C8C7ACB|nr:DUF4352 domain-containing protein [Streptomyces lateritius]MBX9425440.1 DUF4352 domain-containing protein [Streptomyces lateritius]
MRTRTSTTFLTAALLVTLTACSSDKPKSAASPTTTTPKAAASTTPPPPKYLTFGQAVEVNNPEAGSAARTTVIGYQQGGYKTQTSPDQEFNTTGYVWATVEIKVCATKGTVQTSRYPWVLAYADGTRIEPSGVTYGDFPKPEYPYDAKIKAGDCVRGKTVFAVPSKQRPERVVYTAELLPEPAEWAVPAK